MNKIVIIIVSIVLGIGIIGGAVMFSQKDKQDTQQASAKEVAPPPQKTYTLEDLQKGNGINGNDCLVAVDGTVYLIKDFSLWSNGKHTSSNGQAYCGADMSEAIKQSPHGKSKLDLLTVVGTLQ